MDAAWADGQIVVQYYQTCLTLLVWLLATFACLGILASVMLLFLECNPFTRSARRASERANEIGAQGAKRVLRSALAPSRSRICHSDDSMPSTPRQAETGTSAVAPARSR